MLLAEIEMDLMPYESEGFRLAYLYIMNNENMRGEPPLLSRIYEIAKKHIEQEFGTMVLALDMLEDVGVKTEQELILDIKEGILPGHFPLIQQLAHYLVASNLCFVDDVGAVESEVQIYGLAVTNVW